MYDLPVTAILAGGLATRLRPVTDLIPKAMVDLLGRPFVAWQLELLRSRGIRDAVICAGHLGELIESSIGEGNHFGMRIRYSYDGPRLLGTGGAIRRALPLLGDRFFVIYGDSYLPCDYFSVDQAFQRSGKQALMTVFRNAGRWDASNVEMRDGSLVAYDKRNQTARMQHIDYGLGVFSRLAFEQMPADTSFDLADIFQDLLRRDELAAFEIGDRFYEIGSFNGIEEMKQYLSERA
jgi:N-acetyl-alpha-D-muramate 1-phosphate uridylyltransferase